MDKVEKDLKLCGILYMDNSWKEDPIRIYMGNVDEAVNGDKRAVNEKEKEYVLCNCIENPIKGEITLGAIIKAGVEKWVFDEECNFAGVMQNGVHVCRDGIITVPDKKYLLYPVRSIDLDLEY